MTPCPGGGPRYDRAAAASAYILNMNLADPSLPKAEAFGKILFVILDAMYLAEEELRRGRMSPSPN